MPWRTFLCVAFLALPAVGSDFCPAWLSELRDEKSRRPGSIDHHFYAGETYVRADRESFLVTKGKFSINASLSDGVVTFFIVTKQPDGRRDPEFRGKELFDAMIDHFRGQVSVVRGIWRQPVAGRGEDLGDNYRSFTESEARGVSPEQAALETWTGQQACRRGFCFPVVRILSKPGAQAERTVDVEFYATEREARQRREELKINPP